MKGILWKKNRIRKKGKRLWKQKKKKLKVFSTHSISFEQWQAIMMLNKRKLYSLTFSFPFLSGELHKLVSLLEFVDIWCHLSFYSLSLFLGKNFLGMEKNIYNDCEIMLPSSFFFLFLSFLLLVFFLFWKIFSIKFTLKKDSSYCKRQWLDFSLFRHLLDLCGWASLQWL